MSFDKCSSVATIAVKILKIPTTPNSFLILPSGHFIPSLSPYSPPPNTQALTVTGLNSVPNVFAFPWVILGPTLFLPCLSPMLYASSSPRSNPGIGLSCSPSGRGKRINMHHVFRCGSGTYHISSLSISENLATFSPRWEMYSITVEERESEFWWTKLKSPLQPSHLHIHNLLLSTQRTHPHHKGDNPKPHPVTTSNSKARISEWWKVFSNRFWSGSPWSSDLKTKTQAICICPSHLLPGIMISFKTYGTSIHCARHHIQVPFLYVVLADFLTSG